MELLWYMRVPTVAFLAKTREQNLGPTVQALQSFDDRTPLLFWQNVSSEKAANGGQVSCATQ